MPERPAIDGTDARLLERLQVDGRRPYADLGAEVGVSGPSAHERVKKLEAKGVILGYAAIVDPAAGGVRGAGVHVADPGARYGRGRPDRRIGQIPEIKECHHIAGEADYLLKIRAHDTRHLEEVLVRLQSTPNVFTTETDVVLSSGFERRPLRLVEP